MDDTISTHKKERGKGCVRKDFDDLGSMDKNTYMQHGSLGHDVISLLVFGGYFGGVFLLVRYKQRRYMYVLVQFD